jgi:hypothetical protein
VIIEPRNVVWRWTPDPQQYSEIDDIAEEYAIERRPEATAGIILWGKYRGGWRANPSGRAVIAKLLSDLGKTEEVMLEKVEMDRNKIDMSLSGEPVKRFFAALTNLLETNGAQNFLTTEVEYQGKGYAITVEKLHGADSPAQKIRRLEQGLAEARKTITNPVTGTTYPVANRSGKRSGGQTKGLWGVDDEP